MLHVFLFMSESIYYWTFKNSPHSCAIFSLVENDKTEKFRDLTIEGVNQSFEQLFELKNDEIAGKPLSAICSNGLDSLLGIQQKLDSLLDDGCLEFDFHNHGKNQWIKVKAILTENRVIAWITDISKDKFSRDNPENEWHFRQLVENIRGALWFSSPNTKKVLYVSPLWEQISGVSVEKVYADPLCFIEIVHPQDKERIQRAYEKYLLEGYFSEEFRIDKADKTTHWLDASTFPIKDSYGKIIRYAGIVYDITKRKVAEEALRKHDQFLSSIVETQEEMICRSLPDTTLTFVNKTYCKVFRASEKELIGRKFIDFIPAGEHQSILSSLAKLSKDNPSQTFRHQTILPSGEVAIQEWTDTAIFNMEGEIVEIQSTGRDITELTKAKERAEESNRLKSAFLASMNHELRTPLNHIMGFSDLIHTLSKEPEIQDYGSIIQRSGNNLLEMVEDMFALAMAEEEKYYLREQVFTGMDLFNAAKRNLFDTLASFDKTEHIDIKLNPKHGSLSQTFLLDKSKVLQVLVKLFRNAVKFTDKGSIEFGMEYNPQSQLVFYVKDTGIGIAPEILDFIFEPFRQGDDSETRRFDGLGLGLAIAKRLTEILKGKLWVESEPGAGTIFFFSVPCKINNSSINDTLSTIDFADLNLSNKQILLVDDDENSLLLTKKILQPYNCPVLEAENGEKAIKLIEELKDIDLVLMDMDMPVMDGYKATKVIKQKYPDIPVVALTAHSLKEDKRKALEAGCENVITKPINKLVLHRILQKRFSNS